MLCFQKLTCIGILINSTDVYKLTLLQETRLQSALSDSSKVGQLSEKLKSKEDELVQLEEEKKTLESKLQESELASNKIGQMAENLSKMESEVAKLKEEKEALEARLSIAETGASNVGEMLENLKMKESELERVQQEKVTLDEKLVELNSVLEKTISELKESKSREEVLASAKEQSHSELVEKINTVTVQLNDKSEAIDALKKDHESQVTKLKEEMMTEGNDKTTEMQKSFETQLSALKEDHKTVLGKFSVKLKESNLRDKENKANIETLNVNVEQGRKESESQSKKLDELALQLREKEESLAKLREEHQSGYIIVILFCYNKYASLCV